MAARRSPGGWQSARADKLGCSDHPAASALQFVAEPSAGRCIAGGRMDRSGVAGGRRSAGRERVRMSQVSSFQSCKVSHEVKSLKPGPSWHFVSLVVHGLSAPYREIDLLLL